MIVKILLHATQHIIDIMNKPNVLLTQKPLYFRGENSLNPKIKPTMHNICIARYHLNISNNSISILIVISGESHFELVSES